MAKNKIYISSDGMSVTALCDDKIEHAGIGSKQINRAAEVEFNNISNVWDVIHPENGVLGYASKRKDAIALERTLINEDMHRRLVEDPDSLFN